MKITDSYNKVFKDIERILVVMAHPDDNEIICGGLVARLINDGKQVRLVVATNGGKGFQNRKDVTEAEFAQHRKEAQCMAGCELGIPPEENFNLDIPDGELESNLSTIEKIAFHIRQFKPDIVITHNPEQVINTFDENTRWVNHRDHRNIAVTVLDAVYPYSRDRGFFPEHFTKHKLTTHSVSKFLFSDYYDHPGLLYFEVTDYLDYKRKALLQYKEAFTDEEIDGFMEEIAHQNGSFEPLRFVDID